MPSAFRTELLLQRQHAQNQLDSAVMEGDAFLAEVLHERINQLDDLAAVHGVDLFAR